MPYLRLAHGAVPQVTRDAAQNDVTRLKLAVDNERLELQHVVDAAAGALKLCRIPSSGPRSGRLSTASSHSSVSTTTPTSCPTRRFLPSLPRKTYVSGLVNEEDVGALKAGMKAELHLYSAADKNYVATLTAILPSPDTSSRYTVILTVNNPPPTPFLYGLTGDMLITVGRKENALIVPARAVNTDQVLIVDGGVVEQRTVKVGFKSADYAEMGWPKAARRRAGHRRGSGRLPPRPARASDQGERHPGQKVTPPG